MFPKDAPPTVRFGRGLAVYDRATHAPQRTSMRLRLQADGSIEVQVAVMETGTGSHTMIRRVVADGLGLPLDRVVIRYVGTVHPSPLTRGWGAAASPSRLPKRHIWVSWSFDRRCSRRWLKPWAIPRSRWSGGGRHRRRQGERAHS